MSQKPFIGVFSQKSKLLPALSNNLWEALKASHLCIVEARE